jgi:hypothetical protein
MSMRRIFIIVADAVRARFIGLEISEDSGVEGAARLVEHRGWVNSEGDLPERELFSDRMSRAHASPKGAFHALDDDRLLMLDTVDASAHQDAARAARVEVRPCAPPLAEAIARRHCDGSSSELES